MVGILFAMPPKRAHHMGLSMLMTVQLVLATHPPYREQDEISDNNPHAPKRKEIIVPVPRIVSCRLETPQEGIIHKCCCGVVHHATYVQHINPAQAKIHTDQSKIRRKT